MKTKLFNSWRIAALLTVSLFLYNSCDEQDFESVSTDSKIQESGVLSYIKELGFRESSIKEHDNFYLVEGDIMFSKQKHPRNQSGRTQQAYGSGLVSSSEIVDITVAVGASIPSTGSDNWRTEIQQAINDYNGIDASIVHFVYTTGTTADIIIESDFGAFEDGVIAGAQFPVSGAPGSGISINLDYNSNQTISTGQKRYNMVHELGHCIGLRHTNWATADPAGSTANYIQGTPCTDASSVMNGGTATYTWSGFSLYDIIACQMLYPITRPQYSEALLRYYKASTGNHFYTTNFGELYCGSNGYVSEGFEGFVFSTQVSGTIPLYRYYSSNLDDHFYTTVNNAYPNYTYETIAGYVYGTAVSGTSAVYRYYNSSTGDHFYTRSAGSFTGYVSEGVGWYSIP